VCIDMLLNFFNKLQENNCSVKSMVVNDGLWDMLTFEIGSPFPSSGFYEDRFIFNAGFGPVEIIRENKRSFVL